MLRVGDEVERYRVEDVLGRGGAGTVYAVCHLSLGTLHALKLLHISSPMMRERFMEEGRIQARLRHPNVVNVTDVLDVQGHPALLMDYVSGGSLADRLQAGPMSLREALELCLGVVHGVGFAHDQEILHRDLKPANVLVDRSLQSSGPIPRVTDFGLARALSQQGGGLTQTGAMLGTPAYMAPEQAANPSGVDARADIFSLGVLMYEVFTGAKPFVGDRHEDVFEAARTGTFIAPRDRLPALPEELGALIVSCMSPVPSGRPDHCASVAGVLEDILATHKSTADVLWSPPKKTSHVASGGDGARRSGLVGSEDTLASWMGHETEPVGKEGHGHSETMAGWLPNDDTPRASQFGVPQPVAEVEEPAAIEAGLEPDTAPDESSAAGRQGYGVRRRAVWILFPVLCGLFGWTNAWDARLQWRLLRAVDGVTESRDVGVVGISAPDIKALRSQHPDVLRALRDAGVRAVVFDVAMSTHSEHDQAIATAVEELQAANVPVLLPVRFVDGQPMPPANERLRSVTRQGLVEAHRDFVGGQVREVEAVRHLEAGPVWHLALEAVAASMDAGGGVRPELREGDVVVGSARVPADSGMLALRPTSLPPTLRYEETNRFDELAGRVVFIGAVGGGRDLVWTPEGPEHGVSVVAGLTQSILAGSVPRKIGEGGSALFALLSGMMSLGLGVMRSRNAWWACLVVSVVLTAALISGVWLAPLPALLASAVGVWAARRPRVEPQ